MKHKSLMEKRKRSLGKIESQLLSTLSSRDKTIFTIEDAQNVTSTSSVATRLLLSGLVKKKWLIRLTSGKFLIIPFSAGQDGEHSENWYLIAKNLIEPFPYYISYYSALEINEITIQPVFKIYISTPIRRQPKKILGATYQFIYIQEKDIWGIEDIWVTQSQKVKVSDLERTIIDCLNRPELCGGISEIAKGIWIKRNNIDYQKIVKYLKQFNRKSAAKRLGLIIETYGIGGEKILSEIKKLISPSYALLDPTLENSGRFLDSWKLRLNVNPDELVDITKT
jgi:predicted transcriptional regulator of viral defense system